MDKQKLFRTFALPLLAIIFAWTSFIKINGSENVRTIYIVTLIGVGIGIGVLLRNTIAYFTGK